MSEDMFELFESYCTSPDKLGDAGEVVTANALRSECNLDVVRTIYLPSRGHLTEIDMVCISPLGVFVVENKNYKATIRGDRKDYYWTVEYSKANFERLYNPIRQNEVHRYVVKELLASLGYSEIPVYNVVIFSNKGTLDLRNVEKNVFTLASFIEVFNSVKKVLVDKETITKISSLLRIFSDTSEDMRKLHIAMLRRSYEKENTLVGD